MSKKVDMREGSWAGAKGHERAVPFEQARMQSFNDAVRRRALGLPDESTDEEFEKAKAERGC